MRKLLICLFALLFAAQAHALSSQEQLLLFGDNGPSLSLDFTKGVLPPQANFSRASSGTYFDATGTLQTAASNAPRFDYDPISHAPFGLLMEGQSTNTQPNNTMQGAVVGNPGSLPTGYGFTQANGLNFAVINVGILNGINYFDIHVFGTTTTTGNFSNIVLQTGAAETPAAQGQTWTVSDYLALPTGAPTNVTSVTFGASVLNSSNAYLGELTARSNLLPTLTANLSRTVGTGTISPATAAFINPYIQIVYPSGGGVNVDITLRIGMAQTEQQNLATSIIATSGTAATRASDFAQLSLGGWYNPNAGTFAANIDFEGLVGSGINQEILGVGSNSANIDRLLSNGPVAVPTAQIVIGNSSIITLATANHFALGTTQKLAESYTQGGASKALVVNAGTPVSGVSSQALTGSTTLYLGGSGRGGSMFGHLKSVKYWPRALSAAELLQVTK